KKFKSERFTRSNAAHFNHSANSVPGESREGLEHLRGVCTGRSKKIYCQPTRATELKALEIDLMASAERSELNEMREVVDDRKRRREIFVAQIFAAGDEHGNPGGGRRSQAV